MSFGLGVACAAVLAFLLITPVMPPGLTEQIIAGHVRALQPGHLQDVASEDRHTVKPWFDGKLDFAPPVKDLAAVRFPLTGGRLDYLDDRPVAALVYQRDKHVINLFVWPGTGDVPPQTVKRQGYTIVHWSEGDMTFWAVSDLEPAHLTEFAADWRRSQ
jgi:anti-sigma factor RsiW